MLPGTERECREFASCGYMVGCSRGREVVRGCKVLEGSLSKTSSVMTGCCSRQVPCNRGACARRIEALGSLQLVLTFSRLMVECFSSYIPLQLRRTSASTLQSALQVRLRITLRAAAADFQTSHPTCPSEVHDPITPSVLHPYEAVLRLRMEYQAARVYPAMLQPRIFPGSATRASAGKLTHPAAECL